MVWLVAVDENERWVCAVKPLRYGVTTYPVIADPPFDAGAVQERLTEVLPEPDPPTPVGAPGTVAGVTEFEAPDWLPVPTPLTAATWNVYAVPLVSPVTVSVVAVEVNVWAVWAVPPTKGV